MNTACRDAQVMLFIDAMIAELPIRWQRERRRHYVGSSRKPWPTVAAAGCQPAAISNVVVCRASGQGNEIVLTDAL
jgi:hypothetical protein